MDDLKLLKEKIHSDGKVEYLLEELGCQFVSHEQNGKLIVAQLPDKFNSNNRRSIQIKNNESLSANVRSRGITTDLYGVIGYILYGCESFYELTERLPDVKRWIMTTLGYDRFSFSETKKKKDYNGWLHKLRKKRSKLVEISENEVLDESILDEYLMLPNQWFQDDGIELETQHKFEIGFDVMSKRIIIPFRDKNGGLISVKGRYVGDDEYALEHKKYLYLYPLNKSIELYNLFRAKPFIQERKQIIVVEAEKSVMLLDQYGFENSVSLGGDSVSPHQIKLIKDLGVDIDIIFAWDKGKDEKFIHNQLSQFKNREVYYIYDTKDLLKDKQSPCDDGFRTWNYLYEHCMIKYKRK